MGIFDRRQWNASDFVLELFENEAYVLVLSL
jgi:hypothetical protein